MDVGHVHKWAYTGQGTHFVDEPNSKRRSKPVHKVACACGQRGFKYRAFGPVYTWSPDPANWDVAA